MHGDESVQARLEFWLGNAMVTIDGQKNKFAGKRLKDLAREPVKFRHRERDWLVKLGADADSKQFILFINGVQFEDLPEWDDKGICKASMENNWKTNIKKTDYNILDGDVEVPIRIRHDEKTGLTKIQVED